jgi:tellurite methyltransferase
MEADRLKWNERYLTKTDNNHPDIFLQKNLVRLNKPRLLDIAGGNGRNAVFLAGLGFDVTIVDISDVGFQKISNNAKYIDFEIKMILLDLDNPDILVKEDKYNTIVCINFRPFTSLLLLIPQLLNQDGIFIWSSFNELQAEATGFPIEKALKSNEFTDFFSELKLVDYVRFEDETGKRDGYIFCKK